MVCGILCELLVIEVKLLENSESNSKFKIQNLKKKKRKTLIKEICNNRNSKCQIMSINFFNFV